MTSTALLVIGSGPAGLAAAKAFRENGGTGAVRLLTVEDHPPYDRPPLSKEFLRGDSSESDLLLEDEDFYREHDIELVLGAEATGLDTEARTVTTADGRSFTYDALVVATGSWSAVPDLPGADHEDVVLLRSWDEGATLRDRARGAKTAVVIGSGFIGCEVAVSLRKLGLDVTVVTPEANPQAKRLGDEVAAELAGWLQEDGVTLRTGEKVTAIDGGRRVTLGSGDTLEADLVVLATGAMPRTELLQDTAVAMQDNHAEVDAQLRTSVDGVFAAGDIARVQHPVAGRPLTVEHWDDADGMGKVAGTVAAGGEATWDAVPGFWTGIGDRWLTYVAWGDGWDEVRFEKVGDGFVARYGKDGTLVGVAAYNNDDALDAGREQIQQGAAL